MDLKNMLAGFTKLSASLLVASVLAACAQTSAPVAAKPPPAMSVCTEPRPEMCTRQYQPVCAQKDTGVRCVTTPCPSTEWKTYGNGCDACSDAKVIGHVPGACEAGR